MNRRVLRRFTSRFMVGLMILAVLVAVLPLVLILGSLILRGASALSPSFFVNTPAPVGQPGGGVLHAIVGTLIPLIICGMLTKFFGANRSFSEGLRVWPFALFAGLCFTLPYVTVALTLGPEFPSLLGGLIGLAIVVPAARAKFLTPVGENWDFPPRKDWLPEWMGAFTGELSKLDEVLEVLAAYVRRMRTSNGDSSAGQTLH